MNSLPLQLSFLGPEFLTWLYFHIDEKGGHFSLSELSGEAASPQEGQFAIVVGKKLSLKTMSEHVHRVTISGHALDDSGETVAAVRAGAFIDCLTLEAHFSERRYEFALQASDGALGNIKLDFAFDDRKDGVREDFSDVAERETPDDVEFEEVLLLRMSALDEIEDIMDGLFNTFMKRRLSHDFKSRDVKAMQNHVAETLKKKLPREQVM